MEVHGISSWYDQRAGVVVVEDDVQSIVRGMKEICDRLHVFANPQTGEFDVVESCLDGTDRLVFSVPELDGRVLDRLRSADHWFGSDQPDRILGDDEDFVARIDEHNAELERADRDRHRGQLSEVGLRLAHALDNSRDQNSKGGQILVPRGFDG